MQLSFSLAGYVVLLLTPAALLGRALVASGPSTGALGFGSAVGLTGGVALVMERERTVVAPGAPKFGRADAANGFAVAAAATVTYVLSVHGGLGPVVASAAVGLAAGVFASEVAVPAYCGSFVGMASPGLFPSLQYLAVAGALSGLAFAAAKHAFVGFGGKLGTLALFGCATTATLTGANYAAGSPLAWANAGLVVPASVVGAVATTVLSVRLGLGAVVGSALVGLAAGIGLPPVLPEFGGTLAAAAFCASFVGMSSPDRLAGEWQVALAGAVCGLVFVAVSAVLVGAGGKLGTVAFVSCVTVFGGEKLLVRSVPK